MALLEVEITNSGKDPRGVTQKICPVHGGGSWVQKTMMYGKIKEVTPVCKAIGHLSLDKMQCGKAGKGVEENKDYKTWLVHSEVLLKGGADVCQVRCGFD